MEIEIRSNEPYIARGETWHTFTITVGGVVENDDASTEDVIEFLRLQESYHS